MDTKDPDAGMTHGQAAVGLEARGHRKLPVALLLTHSVLACACAALCAYTLYRVHRAEEAWVSTGTLAQRARARSVKNRVRFSFNNLLRYIRSIRSDSSSASSCYCYGGGFSN